MKTAGIPCINYDAPISFTTLSLDSFNLQCEMESMAAIPAPCQTQASLNDLCVKKEAPMGRYYDECEDRYVDSLPSQSDLATVRSYLTTRVYDIATEKSQDLYIFFIAEPDLSTKEKAKRIADGKYTWSTPVDKIEDTEWRHVTSFISFRDTPKDGVAYEKAKVELAKARQEAKDLIQVSTEKEGYDALKAFESKTFH